MEGKRLYRKRNQQVIAGVCSGVADYFDIDVTIVRILWVLAAAPGGIGLVAYIAAALIIPEEPGLSGSAGDRVKKEEGTDSQQSSTDETHTQHHTPQVEQRHFHHRGSDESRRMRGLFIAGVGVLLLADQFVRWANFGRLWPVLLILVGVGMAYRGFGGDK